ncbi:hypothetical protein WUBG_17942, partial [Wuchereria bancrofti]
KSTYKNEQMQWYLSEKMHQILEFYLYDSIKTSSYMSSLKLTPIPKEDSR